MRLSVPLRHAARSAAATVVVALLLLALARYLGWPVPGWTVVGWALASTVGVLCGARLVAVHGTPGTAFLKAHGSCILARSLTFAGGTAWAFSQSMEGALAFLIGVAAGYVPTQILELVWFASQTRNLTS